MRLWRLRGADSLFATKPLIPRERVTTMATPTPQAVADLAQKATDLTADDLKDLSQRYGSLFKLFEQCAAAHRELAGLEAKIEAKRPELSQGRQAANASVDWTIAPAWRSRSASRHLIGPT